MLEEEVDRFKSVTDDLDRKLKDRPSFAFFKTLNYDIDKKLESFRHDLTLMIKKEGQVFKTSIDVCLEFSKSKFKE